MKNDDLNKSVSNEVWYRLLVLAFLILVATVAGIAWQIEQSIQHTEEVACTQFAATLAVADAILITDPDIDPVTEQEQFGKIADKFRELCPDTDFTL